VAEHGSQLRSDLGRRFTVRAARTPLAQPDGEEDRGDADDQQDLCDRATGAAVGD
jgi:hypothetical protein